MSTNKLNSKKSKETNNGVVSVELSKITTSSFNPRKTFAEKELQELADSILQVGVLQPVLVRSKGDTFEIVCGERRFRACVLAQLKTIPAIVRELSDDEALEVSITENLQRIDIKPIEEAAGFLALLETKKYDYAALSKRIGKSEAYVRNRVKLNDLIPEIAEMIDREEINIGIGLIITTYPEDIQRDVFDNHLKSMGYSWWGNLSTTEFKKSMENTYSLLLESYYFDKSDCVYCPHNTNTYILFSTNLQGKCTNRACLVEKNSKYLVNESVRLANEQNIQYVRVEYTNNIVESFIGSLENEGLTFINNNVHYVTHPEAPEEPNLGILADEEDYQAALDEFKAEYEEYELEKANFDALVASGDYVKYLQIKRNRITVGYFEVEQQEEQPDQDIQVITESQEPQENPKPAPAAAVNNSAQIRKLKQQDERNREIMIENIIGDAKDLIRKADTYSGELSDLEIKMMYYFMMPSMTRDRERQLIPDKDFATPTDKMKVIENLTVEKMALIVREYIRVNFNQQTYRGSVITDSFLAFVSQHCPEQLAEISQKYTDVYEKRKTRIDEQLKELTTPVSEPSTPDGMTEQAPSEILPDILPVDDVQMLDVA